MAVQLLPDEKTARKKEMKQLWFIVYLLVVTFLMWKSAPFVKGLIQQAEAYYPRASEAPAWVTQKLVAVNGSSRTGKEMTNPTGIVLHSVAPGLSADQVWKQYQNDEYGVSNHFVVGTDGTILMCIPLTELASAHGMGERTVINIAVCSPGTSSMPTIDTEKALVKLCAWLVHDQFLNVEDVKRHSDVVDNLANPCPLYYASNEEEWREFLADVHWTMTEGEWKK